MVHHLDSERKTLLRLLTNTLSATTSLIGGVLFARLGCQSCGSVLDLFLLISLSQHGWFQGGKKGKPKHCTIA